MQVLITGVAGFIGFHLARRMLADGHTIVGFDAVTSYYDVALKRDRLALLAGEPGFFFVEDQLEDAEALTGLLADQRPDIVVHLAAQAGVRYSIEQPQSYVSANLVGTATLLEALKQHPPRHLIFASSSSVYGGNQRVPYAETDTTDAPLSLYAATKRSGEAMVHAYAHLYGIASTCARFFTVYGPWGRPDMAPFKFVSAILGGRPIDVFGNGDMRRDFSYVDDVVDALASLVHLPPVMGQPVRHDSLSPVAPFRIVNIAGGRPVELLSFIAAFEQATGRTAKLNMLPMQPGDVAQTHADTSLLQALVSALPATEVTTGVGRFVEWYRERYEAERV